MCVHESSGKINFLAKVICTGTSAGGVGSHLGLLGEEGAGAR